MKPFTIVIHLCGLCQTNPLEMVRANLQRLWMTKNSPFRYFKTNPEVLRLATSGPLTAQQGLGVGLGWACGAVGTINVLDKKA